MEMPLEKLTARGTVRFSAEVSDDTFSILLQMRLVSVAALLRRYSPSPHPLRRLLSHVPALAYYSALLCRKLLPLHVFIQGDQIGLPQKYFLN